MQTCGAVKLTQELGCICLWPKALVPMAKCIFQGAVENVNAYFEEELDSVPVPPHLLLLGHSLCSGAGTPSQASHSHRHIP
jgi:hypothetical protein